MLKVVFFVTSLFLSSNVLAWGYMTGEVEIVHVNTYGNHEARFLNNGFCFRIKGYDHFLKLRYHDEGEQRSVYNFTQSLVLAAHMAKKTVRAVHVDWGEDTSCRVKGRQLPAKWLEDVMLVNE